MKNENYTILGTFMASINLTFFKVKCHFPDSVGSPTWSIPLSKQGSQNRGFSNFLSYRTVTQFYIGEQRSSSSKVERNLGKKVNNRVFYILFKIVNISKYQFFYLDHLQEFEGCVSVILEKLATLETILTLKVFVTNWKSGPPYMLRMTGYLRLMSIFGG